MKSAIAAVSCLILVVLAGCQDYNVQQIDDNVPSGKQLGVISGHVCDPSGEGMVSGAEVSLPMDYDNDGTVDKTLRTESQGDGYFLLNDVPDGFWTVFVTKGSYNAEFRVEVVDGAGVHDLEYCLDPGTINIAVVTGEYDTVQDVLKNIGLEFDLFNGKAGTEYLSFLSSETALETYDIVFLNCGINERWMTRKPEVAQALSAYVKSGGSIYASDWSHSFVEAAFPDAVDWFGDDRDDLAAKAGEMGVYYADVIDEGMKKVLGSETAELYYDLSSWGVAEAAGANTEVLIQGDIIAYDWNDWTNPEREVKASPLALKFQPGSGTVIYTSFHNEPQTTVDMDKLLKDIILSL
jgi:hypothetical protein